MLGAVFVVLIAFIVRTLFVLDVFYWEGGHFYYNKLNALVDEGNCRKVFDDVLEGETGSEDVIKLTDEIFVFASGDMLNTMLVGQSKVNNGAIFLLDFRNDVQNPKISKVKTGFPANRSFHSHGMHFSNETRRLYIINHSGPEAEDSVIEVFNIFFTDPASFGVEIEYKGRINGGFGNFMINDVVETSGNGIFVTNFRPYPLIPGVLLPDYPNRREQLGEIGILLNNLLASTATGATGFSYCAFDFDDLQKDAKCVEVNKDFNLVSANGITIDKEDVKHPENNVLYVVDVYLKKIFVYLAPKEMDRKKPYPEQIVFLREIILPDSVDNIEFDPKRRIITAGGIPSKYLMHSFFGDRSIHVPVSMLEINPDSDAAKRIMYHNGSEVNPISSCQYVGNANKQTAICGSPFGTGVLLCTGLN